MTIKLSYKHFMILHSEDIQVLFSKVENLFKNELWPTSQKIEELNENYEIPFES